MVGGNWTVLGVQVADLVEGLVETGLFQVSGGLNSVADESGASRLVDVCGARMCSSVISPGLYE